MWGRVTASVAAVFVGAAAMAPVPDGAAVRAVPVDVHWIVECDQVGTAHIDPILNPGGSWLHLHTFGGNPAVHASSTAGQLFEEGSGCKDSADRSAYWQPTLVDEAGQPVVPESFRAYYRAGEVNPQLIEPAPFGLRLVAGDPMATSRQPLDIDYLCLGTSDGLVKSVHDTAVDCGPGEFLRSDVEFPQCWDGVNLWLERVAHMAYPRGGECPASHPVAIPQLSLESSYVEGSTYEAMGFEGGLSPYGLHADAILAWDPGEIKTLVEGCLNTGRMCGDVTDEVRPFSGADARGALPLPTVPDVPAAGSAATGHG
jgi:hypothetical protein